MNRISRNAQPCAEYFAFPGKRRAPVWRRSLFVLVVLGAHLGGLFLAFGVVSRSTPPEALPALSVRVVELVARPARVDPPRAVEPPQPVAAPSAGVVATPPRPVRRPATPVRRRPAPAPAATAQPAKPAPPAVLAAAADAPTTTEFAVAPAAAAVAGASSAPAPASLPPPLVGARFDADYLRNPSPVYPPASRRLGEEGRVVLRVTVSAEGLPASVEITQSSGYRRLDEAARAAVERWRFVPARRGALAVESSVLIPLQFALRG